ncbi:MAG TPA: hypothetical protein VHU92_26375 [Streptosporangiaceae bacterium]|nr:hypothetical protein [Streptosporangiaceae bacterium]
MRCTFLRAAALLGAFLAALAALPGPALAAGAGRNSGWGRAADSARPAPPSRLLLVNGARAATGDDGGQPVIFPAGRGLAGAVQVLRLGSHSLLIPMAALPFMGRGLSPGLFDLSALARVERGGRLPLTLRFRARLHAPPGVTVTRTGPGTAEGYLTASGARELGAALARQFVADHDRGSYGTDGLFAGGLSLALPGTPSAPVPARPSFPMHTLTVTANTTKGRPDTGDAVFVFNVTNAGAIGTDQVNFFYHGSVRYSVPTGTYWAIGEFLQFHGGSDVYREDVLPQFTVRGSTTVHLSERATTSEVGFAVPRPANLLSQALEIDRLAPAVTGGLSLYVGASDRLWVSPVTRAPADGVLRAYTSASLVSPGHPVVPYAYSLNRADPAGLILRDQRYVARPADLATVREHYYQDVRSAAGGWCTAGGADAPVDAVCVVGAGPFLSLPGRQIQYFTASPASYWSTSYWENDQAAGGQSDAWRLLHGGEHLTEDWNRYPLHPAPNVILPGSTALTGIPSAIRAGNLLSLQITPFSDNTYGHLGTGFLTTSKVSGRYAIYQDGARIAGGNAVKTAGGLNPTLAVQARLSPRPSVIRFVVTASRASRLFPLSAASTDVWTWPSRPEPRATLTAPWVCNGGSNSTDEHCAVQGMLTLRYQVAGLSVSGATRPGRQQIGLIVGHLQEARSSRISSVRAQVSFNGGRTFQRAGVRRAGRADFRIAFTGGPSLVTLRVTARDAAGDTITETLPAAYRIAR